MSAVMTRWLPAALAVATVACGDAAYAQGVPNSDFDTGLQDWFLQSNGNAAAFWSADDSSGRPDSGSALVAAVTDGRSGASGAFGYFYTPLLPFTPGTTYVLGGMVSVDRSPFGPTTVQFGVTWDDCPGVGGFDATLGPLIPEGGWTARLMTVTAPPTTTFGCMFLYASNHPGVGGAAALAAHLDRPFFGSPGTGLDLIFKDGFESS